MKNDCISAQRIQSQKPAVSLVLQQAISRGLSRTVMLASASRAAAQAAAAHAAALLPAIEHACMTSPGIQGSKAIDGAIMVVGSPCPVCGCCVLWRAPSGVCGCGTSSYSAVSISSVLVGFFLRRSTTPSPTQEALRGTRGRPPAQQRADRHRRDAGTAWDQAWDHLSSSSSSVGDLPAQALCVVLLLWWWRVGRLERTTADAASDLHTTGLSTACAEVSDWQCAIVTAFERCDRRHRSAVRQRFIFWTPLASVAPSKKLTGGRK